MYAARKWTVARSRGRWILDIHDRCLIRHGGRHACEYDSPTMHLHMHPSFCFVLSTFQSRESRPQSSPSGAFCILHATDFPGCNADSGSAPTPPASLPPPLLPVLAPTRAPYSRRRPPSPSLPPVMRRIRARAPWIDPLRAPAFILHPIDGVSGLRAAGGVSASACRGWWRTLEPQ